MNQEIDWLRESAKAFAKLKNIKYNLLITHAGKLVIPSIGFDNSHYHHIAGLHKLKDIDQLRLRRRRSTAVIFDEILKNNSVLVLSDKKEALDVVEEKITETLNKVRIHDDFQNPILRL